MLNEMSFFKVDLDLNAFFRDFAKHNDKSWFSNKKSKITEDSLDKRIPNRSNLL